MGAVRYTAGLELRRSWRAVLAFTVVVGLGGAVVLMLLAGARRAGTSYERFRDVTFAADVSVAPSSFDAEAFDAIERLPEVAASVRPTFPFVVPARSGLYPFLDFLALVEARARRAPVDVPRVLEGRLPHPDRVDEIAIIERFAAEAELSVGDRVAFESYTPDQVEDLFGTGDAGPPLGPRTSVVVTGIVDHPDFVSERDAAFLPRVFLTPAFFDEYRESVGIYPGGITVRLHNGERDVPAFTRAVRALLPDDPALEIQPASDVSRRIDASIQVIVTALLLCAASAALASLVAIGFAISRHLSRSPAEGTGLRLLGMTTKERVASSAISMLPAAVGGAALGAVLAYAASPLMPVGVARDADPDLGLSFDPLVLGLGFVSITICVVGMTAASAWHTARVATRAERSEVPPRTLSRLRRMTPIAAPVSRPLGVRMALDPGRGATAVPVRSAALGTVLGVVGVVGAVVFAASLRTTVDRPERFGFPWDAVVAGFEGDRADELADTVAGDDRVAALGVLGTGIAVVGTRDVNVYAFETVAARTGPTMLRGHAVRSDDEVVLGAGTARELELDVGDDVIVRGNGHRHRLEVVGLAALPILDDRGGVDVGAVVSARVLRSVAAEDSINRDVLVRWKPEVDDASATRWLREAAQSEVFAPRVPSQLVNLERVRALPWAVATFLAVVGALAIAYVVVSTVRRRRRDLAMLRTLGLVDRQLSALVRWESSSFVATGLLFGIPLGLLAGGLVWHEVATDIGVDTTVTTPVIGLVLIALIAFVVALVAAAFPARSARRVHPAQALAVKN